MKRTRLNLALIFLLGGSIIFSSCIGSFSLHNRILNWNQGVGSKFVNELVYLAFNIIPIYEVCYVVDALVINSIEFWTGSNPIADIGTVKKIKGENGNYYVKTMENGYNITKEGEDRSLDLIFNKENQTWNAVADGQSAPLLKMNENGTATLFLHDGTTMDVTLDEQGKLLASKALMANY